MKEIYLKEDSIDEIDKLDEYNEEYKNLYPDYVPFVTPNTYQELLENNKLLKKGIGNNGICEIYYWVIEKEKIVGHASIRLNPEIDEDVLKYCGHIMYGVVPSKRKSGYGTTICHLLIEKMNELGYKEIIVTCNHDNIGSSKVIENNSGEFIEEVEPDMINAINNTKRYKINVEKSLKEYNNRTKNNLENFFTSDNENNNEKQNVK